MTSLHHTRIPCRGLAAIALVAVLAALALAVAPAGAAGLPGLDLGSDSAGARRAPVATSENFLLRKDIFTPLEDFPGAGGTSHTAINNRGQTVGTYDGGAGSPVRGFLRDKRGRFTRVDVPGASRTIPAGVNDRGRVVGFYEGSARPTGVGGFVREPDGEITRIDYPGALVTQPHGINNRGQIAGLYVDTGGRLHGFLRSKGSFRKIDVPGAVGSAAFAVNDRGEIVGGYGDTQGRTHGYRLRKGVFTTIDPPGAVDVPGNPGFAATAPFGVNNRGQVVGQYADARGLHAYLLDDGVYTTIDPPAGPGTVAADINERGQIVIPRPGSLFIQY
jgi:uncharacterized membrane protein